MLTSTWPALTGSPAAAFRATMRPAIGEVMRAVTSSSYEMRPLSGSASGSGASTAASTRIAESCGAPSSEAGSLWLLVSPCAAGLASAPAPCRPPAK